jgi:uncharacterized membrane protein YphA (DoxX/SURF4 family)
VRPGPEAWGATLLRLGLGLVYVMHGWYAVAVIGVQAAAGYIVRMGYPPGLAPALAWYLVVVHLAGGALMMHGTIVTTADGPRPIAAGYEYVLLVLVGTLAVALLGPGRLSVDELRARTPRLEIP